MPHINPITVISGIGRRVAELRRDCDLTQAQVAELVGLSTRYLQRLEAGRENLTVRSLVALANIFGVEIAALFKTPKLRKQPRGRPLKKQTKVKAQVRVVRSGSRS